MGCEICILGYSGTWEICPYHWSRKSHELFSLRLCGKCRASCRLWRLVAGAELRTGETVGWMLSRVTPSPASPASPAYEISKITLQCGVSSANAQLNQCGSSQPRCPGRPGCKGGGIALKKAEAGFQFSESPCLTGGNDQSF
jgi:hypothetical protein